MHLPTYVVQILFAVQLPVCLYVGYRVARLTGRPRLNWLIYGFLAAVVFPPFGALLALVALFVCPPARPRRRRRDGPTAGRSTSRGETVTARPPADRCRETSL